LKRGRPGDKGSGTSIAFRDLAIRGCPSNLGLGGLWCKVADQESFSRRALRRIRDCARAEPVKCLIAEEFDAGRRPRLGAFWLTLGPVSGPLDPESRFRVLMAFGALTSGPGPLASGADFSRVGRELGFPIAGTAGTVSKKPRGEVRKATKMARPLP
jgi:hypothetical protein